MNCDDTRRHWNLYHDSEGDPELYFQINEHLAACADCAEWFHTQSRWEDLLTQKLAPAPATPALWSAVLERGGVVQRVPARRRFLPGSLLAIAAGLLMAFLLWPGGADSDLMEVTATYHSGLAKGGQPVEFTSSSDLDVEDYLRSRVSFPVRCPPRQDTGFLVQGAGLCPLADSGAAYLVGRVEGKPVSIFILSSDEMSRFPQEWDALRRERTHASRHGRLEVVMGERHRNVVVVVGETDRGRLQRILDAYGTYPEV